jgi:hypothetical protein
MLKRRIGVPQTSAISTGTNNPMEDKMASFQPRFSDIRYAIGRVVVDRTNALDMSRRQLVHQLGYQDRPSKGHELLSAFMAGANLSPPFLDRLSNVLEIEPSILDAAILATARELDAEAAIRALDAEQRYRTSFRPHLQIQTARRVPSPICVAAMIGIRRLRAVELPTGLASADDEDRDQIARDAVITHFREHRGMVPCFGEITGYLLVLVPGYADQDFGIPFDCQGRRIGSMTTVRRLPDARLGKRRADGRLNGLLHFGPVQRTP